MSNKRPNDVLTSDSENEDYSKRTKQASFTPTPSQLQSNLENIYLDTIDRKLLDFDFEKVCSVTLSNVNVYGCLVCGKYFQGRGKTSPAYFHSVDEDHHVFINFNTLNVYLLPENKLVESTLLDDIKYSIYPTYTKEEVKKAGSYEGHDLQGVSYHQGYIGLNNIKANDYANVVLQALGHVRMIRDFCLSSDNEKVLGKNELNKRFGILMKKMWSTRLFKSHISPHELLQHIDVLSNKKFTTSSQKSPVDFLLWLLNSLNRSFVDDSSKSTVFANAFQGKLSITTHTDPSKTQVTNFWILTLDLPPVSLLKPKSGVQEIPQIHIERLLEKYNGVTETEQQGKAMTYQITRFPPYLVFHFERFKDKNLGIDLQVKDRNQTLVQYPLQLEFKGGDIKYRLVSNIVHELVQRERLDSDDTSLWKVQLRCGEQWMEIQDLNVKEKESAYMFLGETVLQIWERVK